MSEANNPAEAGLAETGAAQTAEIETEDFDRAPAPVEDDADAGPGNGEAGGGDNPNPDADKDSDEAETFEIEVEGGQKFKVPVALKDQFLMRADYTKKTQDVADLRRQHEDSFKAWETERDQQAANLSELRAEHVKVGVIEQQIEQANAALDVAVDGSGLKLRDINWPAWRRAVEQTEQGSEDRLVYARLRQAYDGARQDLADLGQQLDEAKTNLKTKADGLATQRTEAQAAELAKQRQETGKALVEQIPGWNRQLAEEAIRLGVEEYGVTPEEVEVMTDPRLWRLLHDLKTAKTEVSALKKAAQQRTTAQNHERAQQTQPAESGGKGGASPRDPSTARGDGLSTEEWMRRRNAQKAKARA